MKFEMNLSGWVMVLTVLTTFVFLTLKLCGVVAWSCYEFAKKKGDLKKELDSENK